MKSRLHHIYILSLFLFIFPAGNAFAQQSAMTTVAGNGTKGFNGNGMAATAAALNGPYGVAVDSAGNIYITEIYGNRVRKVSAASGVISTIAGNGEALYYGEGVPSEEAVLNSPQDVAVDSAGNIYIADSLNHRIRKVSASSGIITTIAGNGNSGYNGEGSATSAELNDPAGLAIDSAGNVYIAEQASHRVRKVTPGGTISTVAGIGIGGFGGDGGPATAARLYNPVHIALDRAGNLYIADTYNHRVRKVSAATGVITTVAGTGKSGFSGDGASATAAQLDNPTAVAVDAAGNLYISDSFNKRIRRVDANTGVIRTIVGNDAAGCDTATSSLQFPLGLSVNAAGNRIYIVDHSANVIRLLSPGEPVPPTLTSLSPSSGVQGTTLTVTFTGKGFSGGSSCSTGETKVTISGTGVTATDVKVNSDTSVTAKFTIEAAAAPGARNVTVTTADGTTKAQQFTVTLPIPKTPTLTSISPASGLRGSTVSVTLTGSNFQAGSGPANVLVSGSGVSVGNVNAVSGTSLTAAFSIASGAPMGNYNVTVTTSEGTSNAVTFAVNPQGPVITYGLPGTLNPTEQVPVQLTLGTPSPEPVTGKLTLTFTSDAVNNADDPGVTFINPATSTRTITFTFPPNTTTAQFSLDGVLLRVGTVAGTARLTMTEVKVGGKDVSPSNPTFDVLVPRLVPVITSMKIVNRTAAGFDVEVTGYSTSRDITVATFQFAPATGANLQTTQLQPGVTSVFTEYYQSPKSVAVGSAFLYVQPFMVEGDVNAVGSVTLTLTNAQGVSEPKTAQ
jgi:sugar lactone lactonase YvrE